MTRLTPEVKARVATFTGYLKTTGLTITPAVKAIVVEAITSDLSLAELGKLEDALRAIQRLPPQGGG